MPDTHVPIMPTDARAATNEEFAAVEFEPMNKGDIAFSAEGWSNFIGPAQHLLLTAKALLTRTKGELVDIAGGLMSPEDESDDTFLALLSDTTDAAQTFEKYARILRALEARLHVAGAAFIMVAQGTAAAE